MIFLVPFVLFYDYDGVARPRSVPPVNTWLRIVPRAPCGPCVRDTGSYDWPDYSWTCSSCRTGRRTKTAARRNACRPGASAGTKRERRFSGRSCSKCDSRIYVPVRDTRATRLRASIAPDRFAIVANAGRTATRRYSRIFRVFAVAVYLEGHRDDSRASNRDPCASRVSYDPTGGRTRARPSAARWAPISAQSPSDR